jgi:hypothetical protein
MGARVILPKWVSKSNAIIGVLALATIYLGGELYFSSQRCNYLIKENDEHLQFYQGKTAPLVLCARDIPAGTIISRAMIETKIVPVMKFPCHSLTNPDVAIGRELLYPQMKGEPISYPNLGFSLMYSEVLSMKHSKKFNMFMGLASPNPAEFTLAGHKIVIANAWLARKYSEHVSIVDPDFYDFAFTMKVDGKSPRTNGNLIVYSKYAGNQTGFEDGSNFGDDQSLNSAIFYVRCPAKSLGNSVPVKILLVHVPVTEKTTPEGPSQVVTFTLPKH